MQIAWSLTLILVLTGAAAGVRRALWPRLCPLCAGVTLTWAVLLAGHLAGYPLDARIPAILMGGSVVGLAKAGEPLLAGAVEALSEHPLGAAVVKTAEGRGIKLAPVSDFEAVPGKGVRGLLDGRRICVGSPAWITAELGIQPDGHLAAERARLQERARTVVLVAEQRDDGSAVVGLLGIADTLQDDAARTVRRLRVLGLAPVMVTGDNERTARSVAAEAGIDEVLAEVRPDRKAEQVRTLQRQGQRVAFVGDGINDAPALMQADVGIAIGAGTDIAIESADVILTGQRLGGVEDAWRIGRNAYRKTVQNLVLAFSFNGVGVPAAATGLAHPAWAMIAMVASVTAVLANSFGGRVLTGAWESPDGEAADGAQPKAPGAQDADGTATVVLHVPGIHCAGCVDTIESLLAVEDGVTDVRGDAATRQVRVAYRPDAVTVEHIVRALQGIGYAATRQQDDAPSWR